LKLIKVHNATFLTPEFGNLIAPIFYTMKKFTIPLFCCFLFNQQSHAQCNAPVASTDLDIANVRAAIMTGGDMWWDLIGSPRYEVPKGSGKNSLFAGALWIGGYDNSGNLRVAAQTYRQGGSDFWPGPMDTTSGGITPATCSQFDRHWKLTRAEVENFANGGNPTQAIIDYPGSGDAINHASHFLAPYVDMNGDGIYNYLDGDYPMFDDASNQSGCNCTALHGDQVLWWVINDFGNAHGVTNSAPVGVEIQCQAFAFSSADADISNATFYEYKIISRNTTTNIDSTWLGFYVDVELGDYLDDYIGCDVGRGLAYGYNGDANDNGISGYGINPPAVGLDVVHGPVADIGDGIDNDRDSCIDCTFLKDANGIITDTIPDTVSPERIKMSRFIYFSNTNDPVNGNPISITDYYGYMKGFWRNGNQMTYGGNGYGWGLGATIDLSYFMYPGTSDPFHWGTNGIPENDWDEVVAGNQPNDRRFLTSVGPFTMLPGQVQCIQTAVLWAQDTSGPISSLDKLRMVDDKIGGGSLDCPDFPLGINSTESIEASIFPVPTKDRLSFTFRKNIPEGTIILYDMKGKIMTTQKFSGYQSNISCRDFSTGIYFYQVKSGTQNITSGKFVKN